MQSKYSQPTLYFSIQQFQSLDFEKDDAQETSEGLGRDADLKHSSANTDPLHLSTKTLSKDDSSTNSKLDDQCFQDFKAFLDTHNQQRETAQTMQVNIPSAKKEKQGISALALSQRMKSMSPSNWVNIFQLRCTLHLNNKKIKTMCRIKDAEMQFQNGEIAFRLTKITKMKVMYQDYQKCICFSYDQTRAQKHIQLKFKIFVQNDINDDLYVLFSKVVVQKLLLMDCPIDLKQKQQINADKYTMAGELYKLSQFKRQWKMRKLVLTDRIDSFKKEKCTFQMRNIKEIWTRFEIFQKSLVIKLRHGIQKTELAIPVVNYAVKYCKNNWLYRIYRLITSAS